MVIVLVAVLLAGAGSVMVEEIPAVMVSGGSTSTVPAVTVMVPEAACWGARDAAVQVIRAATVQP